jgi:hypothetical protein
MQCDKKKCAPASTLFPTIAHIYMLPSRYRHEVRCNTHIHIHINMTMFSTHVHVTFKVPRRCFLIPSQMGYQNERKNEQMMVQTHYHSGGGVALIIPASNMFLILDVVLPQVAACKFTWHTDVPCLADHGHLLHLSKQTINNTI